MSTRACSRADTQPNRILGYLTHQAGRPAVSRAACSVLAWIACDWQCEHLDILPRLAPPMPRLRPAFCATFLPGCPAVPLADRVRFLTLRSSTRIRSNRRARPVEAFSAQSLRRSASRAFKRATVAFALRRRPESRLALAVLRSAERRRRASRPVRPGQCSISPVDRAALTLTPRSIPTSAPVPGPGTGPGMTANATCQRPERSRVTRKDFTSSGTGRDQRNRTQPALGIFTAAWWRLRRRTSPGFTATIRKPSSCPALRQVGRWWVPAKKFAMACWWSLTACCCTVTEPPASQGFRRGPR